MISRQIKFVISALLLQSLVQYSSIGSLLAGDTNVFELNSDSSEFRFDLQSCDEASGTMPGVITHSLAKVRPVEAFKAIQLSQGERLCAIEPKTYALPNFLISPKGSVLFRVNEVARMHYDDSAGRYALQLKLSDKCGLRVNLKSDSSPTETSSDIECAVLAPTRDDCRQAPNTSFEAFLNGQMLMSTSGIVIIDAKFWESEIRFLEFLGLKNYTICSG